jgi:hypothetical protein
MKPYAGAIPGDRKMARMKDLEIWLRQRGWRFKDFWWMNPRFPGKKYSYQAAMKIQERLEERERNPKIADKGFAYYKTHKEPDD